MPLCFDLDGTLGHFSSGYVLLREALGELWGECPGAEELAACQGSTDWEIVEELHHTRFRRPLTVEHYSHFEAACLNRFIQAFAPETASPLIYHGIVQGLGKLVDHGYQVRLVSGNSSRVLDFKAQALGVDRRIPRIGSLPFLDRAGLINQANHGHHGPHLYVGDRPHDRAAADKAGIPFLGVGEYVPGDHPLLDVYAPPEALVKAVQSLITPLT